MRDDHSEPMTRTTRKAKMCFHLRAYILDPFAGRLKMAPNFLAHNDKIQQIQVSHISPYHVDKKPEVPKT